jgi:hypothetical protein
MPSFNPSMTGATSFVNEQVELSSGLDAVLESTDGLAFTLVLGVAEVSNLQALPNMTNALTTTNRNFMTAMMP